MQLEKLSMLMKIKLIFVEDKKPSFPSQRYQFTVVMPNLNYNFDQDVAQTLREIIVKAMEENEVTGKSTNKEQIDDYRRDWKNGFGYG